MKRIRALRRTKSDSNLLAINKLRKKSSRNHSNHSRSDVPRTRCPFTFFNIFRREPLDDYTSMDQEINQADQVDQVIEEEI